MKKRIASFLGIAMLLSCTACSGKDKETEKERIKRTTESESDTSIETEPDDSGKSSDTGNTSEDPSSSQYAYLDAFTVNEGQLHHLDIIQSTGYYSYGVYMPGEDSYYGDVPCVDIEYDSLSIDSADFLPLHDRLNKIFDDKNAQIESLYGGVINDFLITITEGWDPFTFDASAQVTVIRADEQVVSFFYVQPGGEDYQDIMYSMQTYTICPDCGEDVLFSDIVTDVDAFTDLLTDYLSEDLSNETIGILANECREGIVRFVVSYDGLMLYKDNGPDTGFVKIPAYLMEGMANMFWFGFTPEYYVLYPDIGETYTWDLNDDDRLESLAFECTTNSYNELDHIDFKINGKDVKRILVEDMYSEDLIQIGRFARSLLMKTDSGFFLYLTFWGEDISEDTLVFHITDDLKVEFMSSTGIYLEQYPYNPDAIMGEKLSDLGGTGFFRSTVSVIGSAGAPTWKSPNFIRRSSVLVTAQDLPAYDLSGGTATIPAGTPVAIRFYYEGANRLVIEALDPSGVMNIYEVDADPNAFPPKIAGISQNDAFYGLFYAG